MTEILTWWAIPSLIVLIIFKRIVSLDGYRMRDIENYALNLILALSVIWPAGVIALMLYGVDYFINKFRAKK